MYPAVVQAILDYPKETITSQLLAPVLNKDPNTVRWLAKNRPNELPFPAIISGRSVRFPKRRVLINLGYLPEPREREEEST